MRLLVSSVVRRAHRPASGYLTIVDFDAKRIVMRSPIPAATHRAVDPNPRGGLRGARGVSAHGDRIVVANPERLWIYDSEWRLVRQISHPWMGGVHDVLAEADGIWITCTGSDLLLKTDWEGNLVDEWEWRRDDQLVNALGFEDMPRVDRDVDYRDPRDVMATVHGVGHLNAVTRCAEGLLLSLGRILSPHALRMRKMQAVIGGWARNAGLLVRRKPSGRLSSIPVSRIDGCSAAVVLRRDDGSTKVLKRVPGASVPNHNAVRVNGSVVYNDSNTGRLVASSLNGTVSQASVSVPGRPSFARGLLHLDASTFIVGSQAPAAVHEIDIERRSVVSSCRLDGEPNETVYGICAVPAEFTDPPESLPAVR